jgi:hypothetical protein
VIATIIPITTNTTIAICIQIQNGDMATDSVPRRVGQVLAPAQAPTAIVQGWQDARVRTWLDALISCSSR